MRILYFNILDGEVVKSFTNLPQYKATFIKGKLISIEACFGIKNINGDTLEWFQSQVEEEFNLWNSNRFKFRDKLLKLYKKEKWKLLFSKTNHIPNCHRFTYILVWLNGHTYQSNHFAKIE